jgi:hypothetical protein
MPWNTLEGWGNGTRAGHVGWLARDMLAASAGKIHIHLFPLHYALLVFFLYHPPPKSKRMFITPMESPKVFYVAKPSWHRDKKITWAKTSSHTHNRHTTKLSAFRGTAASSHQTLANHHEH